ncbi:MAG: hypothetical protein JO331_04420 [Verrucomicrobia bacterium]|nr:hypothetical protein [Verrucomicrobiota bacterium]
MSCPSLAAAAHAAGEDANSPRSALDISVQTRGFDNASVTDIETVLHSAAYQIWQYCPNIKIRGIDVYFRPDHPQTDIKLTSAGRITVGLSARNTRWAQYSFQFGHEFCHVLANFSNNSLPSTRTPRAANFWLEEALCETASLFVLQALSRTWQTDPPYPIWRTYAPWFYDYVEKRLKARKHQLPAGMSFSAWFRANEPLLRRNPNQPDQNTIIARQLLPFFKSRPSGWEAVAFLNAGNSDPEETLSQRLSEWRSRCSGELRPFVDQIAAVFGLRLR